MIHRFASIAILGALLCVFVPVAPATVIFTNFGASQSYSISADNTIGNDFVGDNLAEGDTFMPSSTAVFGSLQIALSCGIARCPDFYTVSLDGDSGGDSPGSVLESFIGSGVSLGQLNVNNAPVVFTATGSPITLTAATRYWVTVSSDVHNSIAWNLNSTGDVSDQAISTDGGSTWFSPSGLTPSAYEVDAKAGAVSPEPGAASLLLVGLAWLGVLALKRRRRRGI